jgi:hypothetical protein
MGMVGVGQAGEYMVGATYSFPHRFWTVTGTNTEKVEIRDEDSLHLMATVWDPDTGLVLPISAGVSITVEADGTTIDEKQPWPMISQNMGFHYGDNYQLDGDGTYQVRIAVSGMTERRFGSFAEKFGASGETTLEFDFTQAALENLSYESFEDQGERGAADLMMMEMIPMSRSPEADTLPGTLLGTERGSDEVYVASWLRDLDALDSGDSYLAVSVRTPYNRVPLPMMSLDATVDAGGETVFDDALTAGIHPEIGYHYGAVVPSSVSEPSVTVETIAPPQVSRHEGYETAFLTTPTVTF